MRVTGNKLPPHQRWKPFDYWLRVTVDKCPPPHKLPPRGKCKKIYQSKVR